MKYNQSMIETYFLNKFSVEKVVQSMRWNEFLLLYYVTILSKQAEPEDRLYFSELTAAMETSAMELSPFVKHFSDRGYISWNLDFQRNETYIQVTDSGRKMILQSKEKMGRFAELLREYLSEDQMRDFLLRARQLELENE